MIWCVEDDASIRDIEVYTLSSTGFEARGFDDGVSFWSALQTEKPDLVVLDVMLPGVDGIELLQRMKASAELRAIPVVMATAKGAEYDKIRGLDLGADYYLTKPFDTRELLARLRALTRRPGTTAESAIRCGDVTLDAAQLTLSGPKAAAALTKREADLLEVLLRTPGQLQTRAVLLARVWGPLAEVEDANLDCYIHFVRRRLKAVGSAVTITTVRGSGYKAEVPPC